MMPQTAAEVEQGLREVPTKIVQIFDGHGRLVAHTADFPDIDALAARVWAWLEEQPHSWRGIAEQENRNSAYYRGLVVQIGQLFGVEARTADDGGIHDDVLCAKVPKLVARLTEERDRAWEHCKEEQDRRLIMGKEIERLRGALELYGDHRSECALWKPRSRLAIETHQWPACSCGLHAVLLAPPAEGREGENTAGKQARDFLESDPQP